MSAVPDEQLWSWLDRRAPELEEHLRRHPEDRRRVQLLRDAVDGIEDTAPALESRALPEQVGRYRIVGRLGAGGMGVVYEALQDEPRRPVALKVIRSGVHADEREVQRFRREAATLARLDHAGIARVYEAGRTAQGEHFIAMEKVEGTPLDRYLAEVAVPRRARLALFVEIAAAAEHAHRHGVVHRDLKPSNILVDVHGHAKILDFGLARVRGGDGEHSRTAAGALLGTLPFMSPEQVQGRSADVDAPSDVYSLGVLLYWMLSGRLPYDLEGCPLAESMRIISQTPPAPLGRLDRSLRGDLDTIVSKALEKEPGDRYPSAGALARDVESFLCDRPIQAAPASPLRRAWKFCRRHAALTVLGSLAGLLVLVAAYALVFPMQIPIELGGDWWRVGSPYERLWWEGDRPLVEVDGRECELLAIDGLRVEHILGFCKQHSAEDWRKRFSEDLLQVLNRMGDWCLFEVTLTLRGLDDGEVFQTDAELSKQHRQAVYAQRVFWPWDEAWSEEGRILVTREGREFELLELDGLAAADLLGAVAEASTLRSPLTPRALLPYLNEWLIRRQLYDLYCEAVGRSPGDTVDLVLRDTGTGERVELRDVDRGRAAAPGRRP